MIVKAGSIEAPIVKLALENQVEADDGGGLIAFEDEQLAVEDGQSDSGPDVGGRRCRSTRSDRGRYSR